MVVYGPTVRDAKEREKFWNDLNRIVGRVSNGYRLYGLRDLNGWVGDRMKPGITSSFGVPQENDNGRGD